MKISRQDTRQLSCEQKKINVVIFVSDELCDILLQETGVAILSGTHFGRSEYDLTARLSFVDFNGNLIIDNNNLTDRDIEEICHRTIEGCSKIVEWLEN